MSFDSTRSRNSNSNSKRSFNSDSSNNTGGNKKKKTSQKTLGVAWGSNSRSSSRSSFRSAPFSDFGSYMAVKNKKLHDQFDAEASTSCHSGSESLKPIFQGVSIFVDGFTFPSSQELRGYMLMHGGRFENYFSRRRVTHIICSNLPDSKIKNLRSFSGGLPVVKPTWVLDCVAAGKLLSWVPYQLDQLANEARNQPKLSAFFTVKSSSISQAVSSDSASLLEAEFSELRGPFVNVNSPCDVKDLSEHMKQSKNELIDASYNQIDTTEVVGQNSEDTEFSRSENTKSVTKNNEHSSSPLSPSGSACCSDLHSKAAGESSCSLVGGPVYRRHTTSEDPNFVENYFKSSRLHFIGTWKNRYRKRFANLSGKMKQRSSDVNAALPSRKATIIHVDMDCFFVAVVVRNRPELLDKPVAVCHSDSPIGTAEISSANYPARDYGVKAGMFVRDAKARCPHLLIVPYNFEAYEEVADQFYDLLHRFCNKVEAVSCDEAFLDVTDSDEKDPELLASVIRREIFQTTGCTASAGIAGNLLMARLATRNAKPDGQCYIPSEKVDEYLIQLPIKALPGVGHVLEEKLKMKGVQTCGQLRAFSKVSLQRDFGVKTGEMLWSYCRGVDNRLVGVIQETKSVGAEVNWGVRFKDMKDCQHFLLSLCKEVSIRLQGCGVLGRTFTLKIKKRRKDAEEPAKYMGCGDCENLSHCTTVPIATDDVDILQRITMQLFTSFHLDVKDIRGVGLQVTKLEGADNVNQGHERNTLRSWLASGTAGASDQCSGRDTGQWHLQPDCCGPLPKNSELMSHHTSSSRTATLPSLEDLDMAVVKSLPPDLLSEINDMYGGKLINLISKNKGKTGSQDVSGISVEEVGVNGIDHLGIVPDEQNGRFAFDGKIGKVQETDKGACSRDQVSEIPVYGSGSVNVTCAAVDSENAALMPSSLSQVDISIFQQLPEELRADIVGALPAHRKSDDSDCSSTRVEAQETRVDEDPERFNKSAEDTNLWVGSPPYWVHSYRVSNCLLLNILAEMYLRSGSAGLLSSTLQSCLSGYDMFSDVTEDMVNEACDSFCELLRQYIKFKLQADIEEIYICFRLLKRLALKLKVFSHVYDIILPYLQVSVGESYGGNLHLPPLR